MCESKSSAQNDFVLPDLAAMRAWAQQLGPLLKVGDVVALHGALGAGKTSFARALLQGLGVRDEVPSPTFSLVQPYEIGDLMFWHFDLYRLNAPGEAYELGIEEAFATGASLIEWPENLGPLLPEARLDIFLGLPPDAGYEDTRRTVRIEARGEWATRPGVILSEAKDH